MYVCMYVCIYIYRERERVTGTGDAIAQRLRVTGAAEVIQITTSYKSNARVIHS